MSLNPSTLALLHLRSATTHYCIAITTLSIFERCCNHSILRDSLYSLNYLTSSNSMMHVLSPTNSSNFNMYNKFSCAFFYPLCTLHKPATFDCKGSVYVQRICTLNHQRSFLENTRCKVFSSLLDVEGDINDEACELVNGLEISIGEGVDSIDAYLYTAVKNNNETGILLLSDIFGFEDSATSDFAYRVACNGYNVLVPDLFRGNPWSKDRPKTAFEEWIAKQDPKRIARDIAASAKWMVDEFLAAGISKKLGMIGFCFGGGKVIDALAQDQGACFETAVSFYGTRIDLSVASDVKVPVLFISGDKDHLCPVSVLENVKEIVGKGSRVVIFEGRGHGFAHRPESPEEDGDAEQAFMIMRNWLNNGLLVNN